MSNPKNLEIVLETENGSIFLEEKADNPNKIQRVRTETLENIYDESGHQIDPISHKLYNIYDKVKDKEDFFATKEIQCKLLYYLAGMFTLILNVVITAIAASTPTPAATAIFIMSLLSSIVSSIINFLKIETKISRVEQFKMEFHDLRMRMWEDLETGSEQDKIEEIQKSNLELRKLDSESIDLQSTFLCFK